MTNLSEQAAVPQPVSRPRTFRRAIVSGLGVVLPPLLTIVVFLWGWSLISYYVLEPLENAATAIITWALWDVRSQPPDAGSADAYVRLDSGQWIPQSLHDAVLEDPGEHRPLTARQFFDRYVATHYLRRTIVLPVFLVVFAGVLYVLGKFFAAGVGRWLWAAWERFIGRLPLVRNVYSGVKQVTDFLFKEPAIEVHRVVAVEYPRRGIWAIGFVMGETFQDLQAAANEPVLSVLIPTSPMPATGFVAMVRKSDVIDLNISLDQAIQYIVSCGVVVPPPVSRDTRDSRLAAAVTARLPPPPADRG